MFKWLKNISRRSEHAAPPKGSFADRLLSPPALVMAVARVTHEYVASVKAGAFTYPAFKREGESVLGVWRDTRLEALSKLFLFGESDPMLLGDLRQQTALCNCYIDERAHLEWPQPRGEKIADTVQAVWQIYVYLSEIGTAVLDRETDPATLKINSQSILDSLNATIEAIATEWRAFESAVKFDAGPLPIMPQTWIEVVYEDVTAKTKSIALSAKFGPLYESAIKTLESMLLQEGGPSAIEDAERFRETSARVLNAKDPDNF